MREEVELQSRSLEKLNNDLLVGKEIKFCKLFAIASLYLFCSISVPASFLRRRHRQCSAKRQKCSTMNIAYYSVDKLTFSALIPNNFSNIIWAKWTYFA